MGVPLHASELDSMMGLALAQAGLGDIAGEVPIGALLLDASGAVVASGFNQPISSNEPTAHAEIVVLREAARRLANYRLPDTTLVVTVEPCLMCAGALVNARVARVVYGAREPKWGAMESLMRLEGIGLNHRIEVISGVREKECGELMRRFFHSRRKLAGIEAHDESGTRLVTFVVPATATERCESGLIGTPGKRE